MSTIFYFINLRVTLPYNHVYSIAKKVKSQKCLRNFRDIQAETPFTHTLKTDICVNIFICIILIYVRVFRQRKAVIKTISELFKWSYKVFLTFFYNFSQLFLRLHVYRVSLRSTYLCLPLSVKS